MLVELSVMEQRYQVVLPVVKDGCQVSEVVRRLGVSRQSVHAWIARYAVGGLGALADRSHKPATCPHQTDPEIEAEICELPGYICQLEAGASLVSRQKRPRMDRSL